MQLVRPGTLLRTQAKQAAGCLDPEPHCPQPDSNVQPTNAAHWIWIWPSRSGAEGTELRGRRGRRRREWDLLEAAGRDAGEVEGGGRCGGEERRGRERERHRGPAEHRRRAHGWEAGGARRVGGGSEAEVLPPSLEWQLAYCYGKETSPPPGSGCDAVGGPPPFLSQLNSTHRER